MCAFYGEAGHRSGCFTRTISFIPHHRHWTSSLWCQQQRPRAHREKHQATKPLRRKQGGEGRRPHSTDGGQERRSRSAVWRVNRIFPGWKAEAELCMQRIYQGEKPRSKTDHSVSGDTVKFAPKSWVQLPKGVFNTWLSCPQLHLKDRLCEKERPEDFSEIFLNHVSLGEAWKEFFWAEVCINPALFLSPDYYL